MRTLHRIIAISTLCLIAFVTPCIAETATFPHASSEREERGPNLFRIDGEIEADSDGGFSLRPETFLLCQVGEEELGSGEGEVTYGAEIADPLEPVNRAFYKFNDKLYFWVMKPVAAGYKRVMPEPLRISASHFFSNLTTPIRVVNLLLQGNFEGMGTELVRFLVNSTAGFFGFEDAAKAGLGIDKVEADLGTTLGVYGLGPAFYINWPVLGPSSVRDTFGFAGDYFLDPVSYATFWPQYGARGTDLVNSTSLTLGRYESMKRAALDPYVSLRNAFYEYRQNRVKTAKRNSVFFAQPPAE